MTPTVGPPQRAAWDTYLAVTKSLLPALTDNGDADTVNPRLGGVVIRIRRYAPMWCENGPMLIAAMHSAIRLYRRGDHDDLIALLQAIACRLFLMSVSRPANHPGHRNQRPPRYSAPIHDRGLSTPAAPPELAWPVGKSLGRRATPPHLTSQLGASVTVTRTELANHIEAAFTSGPTSRDALLAYAASSHARPELIGILQQLPDKSYPSIRDLWYDLGHVPLGH